MRGVEKDYRDRIEFIHVNILQPDSEAMMEKFGFSTTPEFYLVDADGNILRFWDDLIPADELRQALDEALQ